MSRVVLITGANRGIGFAILQSFARRSPSDTFILGCRNPVDGMAAMEKLRALGIKSTIDVLKLDVTLDESLKSAVEHVRSVHGKLDSTFESTAKYGAHFGLANVETVLINNAGISPSPEPDLSNIRDIFTTTYNTNVASVASAMALFLPLLKETSADPRIINVGSGTSSFGNSDKFPVVPSVYSAYVSSKTALNMVTLCFARGPGNDGVMFNVGAPGLCRTDLNDGARTRPNARDPLDGAKVYVELALAEKAKYPNGFWFMGDDDKEAVAVPW